MKHFIALNLLCLKVNNEGNSEGYKKYKVKENSTQIFKKFF